MCTITINPASILAVPVGSTGMLVTVGGTVTNCTSNSIKVTITCLGQAVFHGATISGNSWTATVDPKCPCGTPATITATCEDTSPCTATYSTTLTCNCCPQVSTTVNQGLCNSAGQRLITFVTTLAFSAGCSVTVQRDFGDGSFPGAVRNLTSGSSTTFTETHAYAPGTYISNLNVLSNSFCGPSSASVTVPSCPICATSSFWAATCKLFRYLFLLFGAVALVLGTASLSPACVTINNLLPAVAGGFAASAGVLLALLLLICRKCVCALLARLLGQLMVMVGVLLFMFWLPPVCVQPAPFPSPSSVLSLALLTLLAGAFGVLYGSWYQQQKNVCPLTICDYWLALQEALTIAVLAAILVAGALGPGLTISGLGLGLLVITVALISVNHQILHNQQTGNC
jgi:hypothetical protein